MSRRRYRWALNNEETCACGAVLFLIMDPADAGPIECKHCGRKVPRGGRLVEVTPDYVGERRDNGLKSEEEVYGHLQATDGTDLSTRRRHKDYMRDKGLTVADDFKQTWEKSGAEMRKAATPGAGWDQRARREDLGRALHEVRSRGRKR